MAAKNCQFEETSARLYMDFFEKYPNNDLRDRVSRAFALLLKRQTDFPGDPSGWAGGIVYAVGSNGCGVSGVMNSELEKAFGTTMGAIRKRAKQIKEVLGLEVLLSIKVLALVQEFTLRDEANAICAYAFRNGPIEDIHADGRISDAEMKQLMIKACESLAKLLTMKQESPAEYDRFIRDYGQKYCQQWER
ncbi:MAG: hypothetical protein HZA50_14795 [Planctomycetes bacterium]|nr:hypothetical protein [Planctomycetota bacterium]